MQPELTSAERKKLKARAQRLKPLVKLGKAGMTEAFLKNLDKALKVLRGRIYDIELKKHNDAVGAQRKSMVGSGDRSDKIRTYNYPQGRVTDHRIGYSQHNLPTVMDGEIGEFIEQLSIAENAERLKEGEV